MANVIELIPGMLAIRKELASLRALQATMTGEEARVLGEIIAGLELALGDLLKGRR